MIDDGTIDVLSPKFDPVNIGQFGSTGGPKANMGFTVNYNWTAVQPLCGRFWAKAALYLVFSLFR
jgi:hypothetical protein